MCRWQNFLSFCSRSNGVDVKNSTPEWVKWKIRKLGCAVTVSLFFIKTKILFFFTHIIRTLSYIFNKVHKFITIITKNDNLALKWPWNELETSSNNIQERKLYGHYMCFNNKNLLLKWPWITEFKGISKLSEKHATKATQWPSMYCICMALQ